MASPRWSTSMLLASLILLLYWTTSSAQSHDSTSTDLSPRHRISNLATDVEWFSYASVYSQDEVRILNAWKKFEEFRENSGLVNTAEDRLRLAEIFTNYYENTAVEASVANLYHYLTVSSTSLSGNLNDLLRKKFKCSIGEIGKYNIYFSSLLWEGVVLNQLYWDLIGFNPSDKEAEQTKMFKTVSKAQISAVKFCLDNYKKYMKKDMEEIGKAMNPDDKTSIADQVKKALDKKYNWYNWVVLVYNTDQEQKYIYRYNMTNVPVGKITVAVDYTQKTNEERKEEVKNQLTSCYKERRVGLGMAARVERKLCEDIKHKELCRNEVAGVPVTEYIKVMYSSHSTANDFVVDPNALQSFECEWGHFKAYNIHIYYSKSLPVCDLDPCKNKGECERLLDSNEWLCECPDCYYGDRCEKDSEIRRSPVAKLEHPEPDISTLKIMLDKIPKRLGLTSSNQ
ncbi:unnamed protein product [Oreochromis niloticus]|nr:unnamed protein product [Mustela putorius furo]